MAEEVKVEAEVTAPAEQIPAEPTIEEALSTRVPEPKTVPEAAFLEEKKARKALEKDMKALRAQIEEGASKEEVSTDIDAIALESGVDASFLRKYAKSIEDGALAKAQALIEQHLKPIETERQQTQIDKVFGTHYETAMAELPEYATIANREVIKQLSLLPQNAKKTFAQLIEDTYGNAVRGTRTLERTTPRGGTSPGTLDFDRANTDVAYLNEVMKSPELKKQFNEYALSKARG